MTPAITPKPASDPVAIGEEQLRAMAAATRAEIPAAEVRLSGSRARGEARPNSDVDLLLYSRSQVEERSGWRGHLIARACREGRLLDGQP